MRWWVLARGFVSGARLWSWVADAGRWVMATARRIIRGENGGLRVRVDFDEWPSHARVDIEEGWEFSDLDPERAGAGGWPGWRRWAVPSVPCTGPQRAIPGRRGWGFRWLRVWGRPRQTSGT